MTRWHIQTFWSVVSLIALILAIFITCKNANEIKILTADDAKDSKDLNDYKDHNGLIDYNVDYKEKVNQNEDSKPSNVLKSQRANPSKQIFRAKQSSDSDEKIMDITTDSITRKYCVNIANTLRARHKSCFLRPDTGPCRADIIQWYFDARLSKCFRFFFGGCQGNGNKFETRTDCMKYCYLNTTMGKEKLPYFCKQSFDFGTCFGHYYRWYWDRYSKTCKRRLYSGCGGNQNNFQSYNECFATCVTIPNDTVLYSADKGTTCFPL